MKYIPIDMSDLIRHKIHIYLKPLPPETANISPVIKSDSSDAKNNTAFAISSGFPILFKIDSSAPAFILSLPNALIMSVSVRPGHMALTFIFGPKFTAKERVKPINPAFETAYAVFHSADLSANPQIEDMFIILPFSCFSIIGATSLQHKKAPLILMSIVLSQMLSVV